MSWKMQGAPERKYHQPEARLEVTDGQVVAGYASLFGKRDQGGDVVVAGAYAASLRALAAGGRAVKMLWQHDPAQPIGVWDEVREDAVGLWVKGRILTEIDKGREAVALLTAGAIDGLSIGYRTVRAERDGNPVLVCEDMPDIAANAFAIAFGDFAAGYTIAERPDLRILRDPFSAKPHVLFYASKRVGGDVTDFAAIKLLKIATA